MLDFIDASVELMYKPQFWMYDNETFILLSLVFSALWIGESLLILIHQVIYEARHGRFSKKTIDFMGLGPKHGTDYGEFILGAVVWTVLSGIMIAAAIGLPKISVPIIAGVGIMWFLNFITRSYTAKLKPHLQDEGKPCWIDRAKADYLKKWTESKPSQCEVEPKRKQDPPNMYLGGQRW